MTNRSEKSWQRIVKKLDAIGREPCFLRDGDLGTGWYCAGLGPFETRREAEKARNETPSPRP